MVKVDNIVFDYLDKHNYIVYEATKGINKNTQEEYDKRDNIGYHSHWSSAINDIINRLVLKEAKEATDMRVLLEEMKTVERRIKEQFEELLATVNKRECAKV